MDLEYAAEPGDADADADDAEEQPAVVAALVVPAGAGDAVAGGLVGAVDLVEAGAAGLEESPVEVEPAEEPEAAQVVTEAIRVMAIRPAARTADDVEAPGAEEVAGGGQAGSSLFVWRGGPGRKCFWSEDEAKWQARVVVEEERDLEKAICLEAILALPDEDSEPVVLFGDGLRSGLAPRRAGLPPSTRRPTEV